MTLGYHLIRLPLKYLAFLFRIFERPGMRKYSNMPLKYQPIFIIGAPRTGSTILYQILTNYYDVLYIDNLVNLAHRSLYFGFWLSDKIFKHKAHNCYKSEFGITTKYGFRAPNEGGEFWYRYIKKDKIYIAESDIDEKMLRSINKQFVSVINKYNKPLIYKNLYVGLRLHVIKKIFPDAKFVFVRRDPLFTAQSLYKGRLKKYGIIDKWFGIKPPNYSKVKTLNVYDQIVQQIFHIEKTIYNDLKLFPSENVFEINYVEFCNDWRKTIDKFGEFFGYKVIRDHIEPAEINVNEEFSLGEEILSRFNKEIEKYDWVRFIEKNN